MLSVNSLPPQQLSYQRKNKEWRKKHLDWADGKTFFNYSPVRNSVMHKKINYDLVNGKLHMEDLQLVLNPESLKASYIPKKIQHYAIMNPHLEVLIGEELARQFDFRVVVTNPNAISEIENRKKEELGTFIQNIVQNQNISDEEAQQQLQDGGNYFTYEWQDEREIRANALLNHYVKEYNMPLMFNKGFMDALIVGEEIYRCDIVSGEPIIEKLNPLKLRVFRAGLSSNVEDADVVVYEDYWSPGKIIDTYFSDKDASKIMKYLENPKDVDGDGHYSVGNINEDAGFMQSDIIPEKIDGLYFNPILGKEEIGNSLLPFDTVGNVKVVKVYWKSRRKIKKVKSYNPETGESEFNFYTEDYICDEYKGEEEEIFWVNEAWEGTKIGSGLYVNMRPRTVQYNRISNPSLCHFGIIGSFYTLNEDEPYSMVDKMKPYAYLYDAIQDRLNKLIARSWGPMINVDFGKMPANWTMDKWMYFAKTNGILVTDSTRVISEGPATGKLAGSLNNNNQGGFAIDSSGLVHQYLNMLQFIETQMGDIAGITPQRKGQVSNRETVGGVERATLQSSHITEKLFAIHNDIKRRVLECFLETAKIAMRGKSKKFQYLLPDSSLQLINIDGDTFAECDCGLAVDDSNSIKELNSKIDILAQAALQNQALTFSAIMKLYNSTSLAEKQRMIERTEKEMQQRAAQQKQQEMQLQQQQLEMQAQQKQAELEHQDTLSQRDNDTKITVAEINSQAEFAILQLKNNMVEDSSEVKLEREKLQESMRQFDEKSKLENQRLEEEKRKNKADEELKRKQINKHSKTK